MNRADTDLEKAKKIARKRAEEAAKAAPPPVQSDEDEAACFVRLVIEMFTSGLRLGMGTMPDGMAIWIRLSVPREAVSPYAGLVSFVVSDDTLTVLRKAVASLEAAPKPPYWKPDQFARGNTSSG
jgi:hypothetical protein